MPEAVIVSTARSPIGRAVKGSLVDVRPDNLAATIVNAALEKVPALDRNLVEDLIMGSGQPGGEAGYNLGRMVALLADMPDVPGVTVNRYCSSSLQTIRMAAHAIKAGEGDIFISAGVETVSRYMNGAADTGPHNARFSDAEARTAARTGGGQGDWTAPEGLPDAYIAMGQTAENVAEFENVSREEMDAFAAQSQQRATAALERGFFDREITPVTTPDGTVVSKDDGIRPGSEGPRDEVRMGVVRARHDHDVDGLLSNHLLELVRGIAGQRRAPCPTRILLLEGRGNLLVVVVHPAWVGLAPGHQLGDLGMSAEDRVDIHPGAVPGAGYCVPASRSSLRHVILGSTQSAVVREKSAVVRERSG